jgi:hypothetical protein
VRQINVYSVSLAELLTLPGSGGNEELIESIRNDWHPVNEIDHMISLAMDEDGTSISFLDIVARIINGQPLTGAPDFACGYAYEAICWGIGSTLCWVENYFRSSYDDIDRFLKQAGLAIQFWDLCYAGPILHLPPFDDYPYMGWWTPNQIDRAVGQMEALSLDGVDPRLAADVSKIRDRWLAEVTERPGDCIVGFGIA